MSMRSGVQTIASNSATILLLRFGPNSPYRIEVLSRKVADDGPMNSKRQAFLVPR